MTTISTTYAPASLDEKHRAVFHHELVIEQRPEYTYNPSFIHSRPVETIIPPQPPTTQNALLLKAAREQYTLVTDHAIPSTRTKDEILVKVCLSCPVSPEASLISCRLSRSA